MTKRLDGIEALRGVAALLVAFNHAGFNYGYPTPASELLSKSYLAVDLFFCLSGFVLARRYEGAMPEPGQFLKIRFVRLWGPVALGVAIGAVVAVWKGIGLLDLAVLLGAGLAVVPAPNGFILLNPPAWSIFFELVANWFHAALLGRLRTRSLALIAGGCAALFVLWTSTGGDMDVGQGDRFVLGLPRVLLSYIIGVILWRMSSGRTPFEMGNWTWLVLACYCAAIVMAPKLLGGLGEVAFVLFLNPLVLVAVMTMRKNQFAHVLGALSFPLYALHDPLQFGAQMLGASWLMAFLISLAGALLLGLAVDRRLRSAVLDVIAPSAANPRSA